MDPMTLIDADAIPMPPMGEDAPTGAPLAPDDLLTPDPVDHDPAPSPFDVAPDLGIDPDHDPAPSPFDIQPDLGAETLDEATIAAVEALELGEEHEVLLLVEEPAYVAEFLEQYEGAAPRDQAMLLAELESRSADAPVPPAPGEGGIDVEPIAPATEAGSAGSPIAFPVDNEVVSNEIVDGPTATEQTEQQPEPQETVAEAQPSAVVVDDSAMHLATNHVAIAMDTTIEIEVSAPEVEPAAPEVTTAPPTAAAAPSVPVAEPTPAVAEPPFSVDLDVPPDTVGAEPTSPVPAPGPESAPPAPEQPALPMLADHPDLTPEQAGDLLVGDLPTGATPFDGVGEAVTVADLSSLIEQGVVDRIVLTDDGGSILMELTTGPDGAVTEQAGPGLALPEQPLAVSNAALVAPPADTDGGIDLRTGTLVVTLAAATAYTMGRRVAR